MPAAPQARLERARAARAERAAEQDLEHRDGERRARPRPLPPRRRLDEGDGVALEVEQAVEEGLREPVLRRGREEGFERARVAQHHRVPRTPSSRSGGRTLPSQSRTAKVRDGEANSSEAIRAGSIACTHNLRWAAP